MRKEILRLWEQALYDLDTAGKLVGDIYYASVFFSQQAAEKALKALYLKKKHSMEFTHDLIELAEGLNAPDEIMEAACELSPDYVISRSRVLPMLCQQRYIIKSRQEYTLNMAKRL